MTDSPISATPYEVLGVAPTANDDDLKRAYRRALRDAHPDTGGSAAQFTAVQNAWERIGTPAGRAIYDRVGASRSEPHSWATPRQASKPADTRPRSKSYGHPGGWRRERYLTLMREWAGRGATVDDPYDPTLVASAPREIRHILADALAEESTARALTDLGIGFTVWHDVATGAPDEKIDHIVLGPTGLFALLSEDYGDSVRPRRGELIGDALDGEKPFESLGRRAKIVSKALGVKFTVLAIVLPDDALDEAFFVIGKSRGALTVAVRQSHLPILLRDGLPDTPLYGGTELFEVRTRLQSGVRFVAP